LKRKGIAILTLLIFLFGSISSTAMAKSIYDKVKKRGVVKIGLGVDVPPLSMLDPKTGKRIGFDIDLAYALVDRLSEMMGKKLRVEDVTVNNKTRIAFLANRRVDLTIRSMSHTRSRDEQIDYAEPSYLWSGKVVYAKKGKFKNVLELCGKRWAVVQGSNAYLAAQDYMKELGGKKNILV